MIRKMNMGFVILLLIHENGHMLAAKKTGLPVSKPIFIPFVGAFISMKEMPKSARQEAIIGMGGPLLGGLASIACFFIYDIFNETYWLALGYTGCFLNLFNLVPLGFLDGGRIATAISIWLWVPGAVILGIAPGFFDPSLWNNREKYLETIINTSAPGEH